MTILAGLVAPSAIAAALPPVSVRDLRDYVLSSCFIQQKQSAYLREQGYYLGDILSSRTNGAIIAWRSLDAAISAELARAPAFSVHGDGPVNAKDKPAPVAQCLTILDAPSIRRKMEQLRR